MFTSDLPAFVASYIETALWSSTDDDGMPMDSRYSREDLSSEAVASIEEDCREFVEENAGLLADIDVEMAGHDFWLTRNRHGAGFWDRGYGAIGDELTAAAHSYGSSDLYVGDDGKLYVA